MKKSKLCVMGRFYRDNACDGQTIKTIEIVDELIKRYGMDEVRQLNYYPIKHSKPKLFAAIVDAFMHSERIIIAANTTSVTNLLRACTLFNKIFKRKLYFILVGAALTEGVDKHPAMLPILKQFDAIILESETLRRELSDRGLERLYVMSNFKTIRRFTDKEQPTSFTAPYPLVYMSRIVELKGVAEMIEELKRINKDGVKYTLDMYGMIDEEYEAIFDRIRKELPDYIKYKGIADAWQTSEIMNGYFLQLFPTKCATEGQPASIIDSFFAGTPVLAGRWNFCADMVREGQTGASFELCNFDEFRQKLEYFHDHPDEIMAMRTECVKEAEGYIPSNAVKVLIDVLEQE